MEDKRESGVAAMEAQGSPKVPEAREEQRVEWTPIYRLVVGVYRVLAKVFFRVQIEGMERVPKGACVLMSNHKSNLDPITLALCTPDREIRFMGKKELFENPLLRWVFTKLHGFAINRDHTDMAAVRTALRVLDEGKTLGIFPEGTRSKTEAMGPLLGGASLIALRSGRDVVPVYIDGQYKLMHRIIVRIGEPIKVSGGGRINKERCEQLTRSMEDAFAQLSGGKSRAPEG